MASPSAPTARELRDVVTIDTAQRLDLLLDTTDDGLHAYGSGVWLFHDHGYRAITTDGIGPGGHISAIVYEEYLDADGWPMTQGVGWAPYFSDAYYRKAVPVWQSYAPGPLRRSGHGYPLRRALDRARRGARGEPRARVCRCVGALASMSARRTLGAGLSLWLLALAAQAQPEDPTIGHHHGAMAADEATALPRDCDAISAEHEFTVHAGTAHRGEFPGTIFGYDQRELRVEPCSRITVTFVNDDDVRHQWMVHGLPRYLYPGGMFHLEANGRQRQTGSFVVPSDDRTYLVHCDLAQHMEKGMKAQLIVGRGNGDLWAIPGVSAAFNRDDYTPRVAFLVLAISVLVVAATTVRSWKRRS